MSALVTRLNQIFQGEYRLESLVADGAIASVYEAEDSKRCRRVAFRVLRREVAAVVGAHRFLAEIEKTKRLSHPNILELLDAGSRDGFIYYVVPLLDGESLRERLRRVTRFPVSEAVSIASAVGSALHHAHALGLMHGDVTPSNVLFHSGEPLLSSFGVARAVGVAGARLTEMDLAAGTPYYMSPERAMAAPEIGPASEQYALACILYEMLVGAPPFVGSTAQIVLSEVVLSRPVPPVQRRANIPLHVDAAVRRALEKRPADRFESCEAFVRALADARFTHEDAEEAVREAEDVVGALGWSVADASSGGAVNGQGATDGQGATPGHGATTGHGATPGHDTLDGHPDLGGVGGVGGLGLGLPGDLGDGLFKAHADRLLVKEDDSIRFINVADIRWVESEKNYLRIHTDDAEYLVRRRIGELEAQLDPKRFQRIHRSTIVNLDSVDRLVPWFSGGYLVHLRSGEELKLSRGYANKLFDQVGKTF